MKVFILCLLIVFPLHVRADRFKLIKAGEAVTFTEDQHCTNNENALKLLEKLKLCDSDCEAELEYARGVLAIEEEKYEGLLSLQADKYNAILLEKDKSFIALQTESLKQIATATSTDWWQPVLWTSVGVITGALVGGLTVYFTR